MNIDIHYCVPWNYEPQAASLADELRNAFCVEANLVPGTNGIFDVVVDNKRVFSKSEVGRFPHPGEVTGKLKSWTSSGPSLKTMTGFEWTEVTTTGLFWCNTHSLPHPANRTYKETSRRLSSGDRILLIFIKDCSWGRVIGHRRLAYSKTWITTSAWCHSCYTHSFRKEQIIPLVLPTVHLILVMIGKIIEGPRIRRISMVEKQVIMYSLPTWPHCIRAKEYLSRKGIHYIDYDVAKDTAKAKEMIEKSKQRGTPVIFVDDEMVIGFDQVRLDELLGS